MSDDLVKRLRNTPNWKREGYGNYKSAMVHYDRAPFEAADRIEELEAELHLMKTAGIVEVAIRNPNVSEYMAHWERRAEGAEAKLTKALEDLQQLVIEYDEVFLAHDEPPSLTAAVNAARTALAELKGKDDE